jgi:hypothetical protein
MTSMLMTAWLLTSSAPAPNSSSVPLPQPSSNAAALYAAEDSTANLLQAYDPLAAQMTDVEPEEIQAVLSPTDQGGWNG